MNCDEVLAPSLALVTKREVASDKLKRRGSFPEGSTTRQATGTLMGGGEKAQLEFEGLFAVKT